MASAVLLVGLLLPACTDRLADFTMISTKNVDLSKAQVDASKGSRVTEDDCRPIIIVFPVGRPDLKEAVDSALEKGRGNLMIDLVAYSRVWYVPPIFGLRCMVAEGTVVNVVPAAR